MNIKKERVMKVLTDLVDLSIANNDKLQTEEARILNSIVTTTLQVVTKEIAKLTEEDPVKAEETPTEV